MSYCPNHSCKEFKKPVSDPQVNNCPCCGWALEPEGLSGVKAKLIPPPKNLDPKEGKPIPESFIQKYGESLAQYWSKVKGQIVEWRESYCWPANVSLAESIKMRDKLEADIKRDLVDFKCLTKKTFDEVMLWGFGRISTNTDMEIRKATKLAFEELGRGNIALAAGHLCGMRGIGISRASKVLALSDQKSLGIYDSRAAHGLRDLELEGKRLIPIPPGRVVKGDRGANYLAGFETYTYVLRYLHRLAFQDPLFLDWRVADYEIAIFSRSRQAFKRPNEYRIPLHLRDTIKEPEESDQYWTLAKGKKSKVFWGSVEENGIRIFTGPSGETECFLDHSEVDRMLQYFSDKGWFLLGNNVDNVKSASMGEYFQNILHKSPKFASHYAAILVNQRRLRYDYNGSHGAIRLNVLRDI